jgi:hypothetical protein
VLWLATGNSLIRYEIKTDARKIYYNDPQDPTTRASTAPRPYWKTARAASGPARMEWRRPRPAGSGHGKFRHFRHSARTPQPERRQHRQPA